MISVIITAYECARYLGQAIDSVLAQARPAQQVMVIDDGSTDGCAEVVHAYGDAVQYFHQANRGAACVKPLHLPAAVHARDRATAPLVRGSREERWRPATWRSTIALLARRLKALAAEHGPDAIAFYVSGQLLTEDYYAVNKLAKGFLGTNNVDSNSRLCMSSAVAGYRESLGSDGPPASYADIDQADCLLLLGSNTAACQKAATC